MSPMRLVSACLAAAGLALPAAASAQTANGSPTDPAPPGLIGTPRPISRTAPSTGGRAARPGSTLPAAKMQAPPKPTAAELAERRKLDHDLRICIGC